MKDALFWICQAWDDVTTDTIQKCFERCGFKLFDGFGDGDVSLVDDESNQSTEDYVCIKNLAAGSGLEILGEKDFECLDGEDDVHDIDENWEQELLSDHMGLNKIEETASVTDDADSELNNVSVTEPPSRAEVRSALQILKDFSDFNDGVALATVMKLEVQINLDIMKQSLATSKQTEITNFFGPM